MSTYEDLIGRFMYESLPLVPVNASIRFETAAAEVIGTKQRRYGPLPSPEIQVAVREYIRSMLDNTTSGVLTFFLPWGSSKQEDGRSLDIAEFMAMKQLHCLHEGLLRYGVRSQFYFRVENLTDQYLFGDGRRRQIDEYLETFGNLVRTVLGICGHPRPESWFTTLEEFRGLADQFLPTFYGYLLGNRALADLQATGWLGEIPAEQREYYYAANRSLNPGKDPVRETAKYFAATLARHKLAATGKPSGPHLTVSFTHPVPGNPITKPVLYYRTIPERYTNNHKSPWLTRGYFEIHDNNEVVPKLDAPVHAIHNCAKFGDLKIDADYVLV